jgi:hypothetical protein
MSRSTISRPVKVTGVVVVLVAAGVAFWNSQTREIGSGGMENAHGNASAGSLERDAVSREGASTAEASDAVMSEGKALQKVVNHSQKEVVAPQKLEVAPGSGALAGVNFQKGTLSWELQLESVKRGVAAGVPTAKAVFALLPYLPEEALQTVTEEALSHLPDAAWTSVALPVLANSQTHGRVLSTLFADLMERPQEVSVPALNQVARDFSHPFSSFALDNLKLLLGEEFVPPQANVPAPPVPAVDSATPETPAP